MPQHVHQIDYAPPRRRPAWLNRRTVMIGVLVVGSALAAWVVVPPVLERAAVLKDQAKIAQTAAGGTDLDRDTIVNYWLANDLPGGGIGFDYAGMRSASDDAEERLVVLSSGASNTMIFYVIEPATWSRPATLIRTSTPQMPFPWSDFAWWGPARNDPRVPSRFTLPLYRTSREPPFGQIVGHLLANDTVRLEYEPLNVPNTPETK